ncbi:hypothetical protein F4776DRAFT_319624 [Hypoxylon sp. NC0597]|nr:hypothetical protein F4776DRAFT_319624 [Hypoxylon sp. NC0597]
MDLHTVFNHLVLPPQLPGNQDSDIQTLSLEISGRLIHACETVNALVDRPWSDAFEGLLASLNICGSLNSGRLEKSTLLKNLRNLEPNVTLVLYVVEQNAALLIRRDICHEKDGVTFEAFETSASSEQVLAADHALQWDFPGRSAHIPFASFADEAFQESLASFLEQASVESLHSLQARAQKAKVSVTETRDTTNPALITQMLMPLLEAIGGHFQAPILRKRVRDDVNFVEGDLPWRRLPFWLVLRVAAQRQLCLALGNKQGRMAYKFLMNILFSKLLEESAGKLHPELTTLLRVKLCRRMAKLEMDRTKMEQDNQDICGSLFTRISPVIRRVIEEATAQVETAWESFRQATTRNIPGLPRRAPEDSLQLSLPNSGHYLDCLLSSQPPRQVIYRSHDLPQPLERTIAQSQEFTNRVFRLATTESSISFDMPQPSSVATGDYETRCVKYARRIHQVFDEVGTTYDSDPELMSTMILTLFTLWVRLDEYAVAACPILRDHRPVFDPELLDVLQLPTLSDMRRLQEVQLYLAKRRSGCSCGTIFEKLDDCLAVRYVSQAAEMQLLGPRIQRASNKARNAKESEWKRACEDYDKHTEGFLNGTCRCSWRNGERDVRGCEKCWHQRARNRMKIEIHEAYLPEKDPERSIVIFELGIPNYLSAYRNATWRILCALAHPSRPSKPTSPAVELKNCTPLRPYLTTEIQGISVASTVKCFEQTHYKFKNHKVPLSQVLLPLAAKFELYDHASGLWIKDLKKPLTFGHLCGIHVPRGLQTTILPGKQHPPRIIDGPSSYQVLANQADCPSSMSTHEFSTYQKLLGGKVRRWPNMLVEMGSSNLNFNNEDTARLFCQLAVQAGPYSSGETLRSVHVVFKEEAFLERLTDVIRKRLCAISANWRECNHMELLITLTLRLIHLSSGGWREKGEDLLKTARDVTLGWTSRLREETRAAVDADTVERLATYGFYAALLCRRTFAIYVGAQQSISSEDLTSWVQASVALQDNLVDNIANLPQTLKSLLIRDAKIAYHLQFLLETAVKSHPKSVGDGIARSGFDSVGGITTVFSKWTFLAPPNDRWVTSTTTSDAKSRFSFSQTLHFNIVQGHLLVNGRSRGKLPLEIRSDQAVKDMFRNQHLLTYPSSLPGMTHRLTVSMYGQEVHFGFRDGRVIIRARASHGLLEFIPRSHFTSPDNFDLPAELVDNCVHWLNLNTECLEVRRMPKIWHKRDRDWEIHVPSRRARRGQSTLVDPQSNIFIRISEILRHFERPERLTIFQPQGRLSIELRHMELSFFVNNSGLLECRQLEAEIDPNQDVGTWYGLKSKIALRDVVSQKRSIIIPLGKMQARRHGMHVEVYTTDANEYGRYVVDDILHRLSCPPEPLLLYTKALCHALTSFCLPDALTGRTGTEEAFRILRSGAARPWTTLGKASLDTLARLGALSPQREYYPPQMRRLQRVKWNRNLTTAIQHDGYESLILDIGEGSRQLDKFNNLHAEDSNAAGLTTLRSRGVVHRQLYERPTLDTSTQTVQDTCYVARDDTTKPKAAHVYEITSLITRNCSEIHMDTRLIPLFESWPVIGGFHGDGNLLLNCKPLINQIADPINEQWGDLVDFCRRTHNQAPILFCLGLLAFGPDPNMDAIRLLAAFACMDELKSLKSPTHDSFVEFKSRGEPSISTLQRLIAQARPASDHSARSRDHSRSQAEELALARHFRSQWPTPAELLSTDKLETRVIDASSALGEIEPEWERRRWNTELENYIHQVQTTLDSHQGSCSTLTQLEWKNQEPTFLGQRYPRIVPSIAHDLVTNAGPYLEDPCLNTFLNDQGSTRPSKRSNNNHPIDATELEGILNKFAKSQDELRKQYGTDLLQSLAALKKQDSTTKLDPTIPVPTIKAINQAIEKSYGITHFYLKQISTALSSNDIRSTWLKLGDIWPCKTPTEMLELLRSTSSYKFGAGMKESLVRYGLAIASLQRLERIRNALLRQDSQSLNEDIYNEGHKNWSPYQLPDWLLLEIESNFLIRVEQVDVARAIIKPSSGNNSVLQMNMGKGKTSCIVPMVVASLADGDRLLRLIVPKALISQTAQIIQSRLGGFVGREVRHVPFSRKTPTTPDMLKLHAEIHHETRENRGLILTNHENILSYKLGGWQHLADGKLGVAKTMIEFQGWLDSHCRDILDECDFTLSVKTQLNYPGGSEMAVDGHPFRWQVAQDLLALAARYVPVLKREFPRSIDVLHRQGSYPMVYFLKSDVEDSLHNRILDDVCAGRTTFLRPADTNFIKQEPTIRKALTEQKLDKSVLSQAASAFVDPPTASKILLVVRGLVMNRILLLCLGRRWNVQYGLHPGRDPIAVPFEAKGTPSEQSEFGHPDVAILFTCLSFYYTGLTAKQFRQGLQHVLQADDPAMQYELWISGCHSLPEVLRHWNAINIDDGGQMEEMWQHLRLDRAVINYYMNHFVFPAHARQFNTKLQASAWDIPLLCGERSRAKTTGFSGTNDNRITLPLTVQQDDLPSLQQTSAEVLSYLLQPRNRGYQVIADGAGRRLSERNFLCKLKATGIRVLIDAGAYILEMDNWTLADTWLTVDHEAKAAVYFNNNNKPMVHYRGGAKNDLPLLATPFAHNLSECIVYLDQAHTRGIDFKLPSEAHGAVTLALGQSKDFTMQAAMRLRQLRTTQQVTFFSPPEVDQSIRDFCRLNTIEKPGSIHVITWLLEQTCRGIEDLRSLYVAQGIDFCRRTDATFRYTNFIADAAHRRELLNILRQPERQTLEELYGGDLADPPTSRVESMSTPQLQAFLNHLFRRHDNHNITQNGALEIVEQEREVQIQVEQVYQSQKPPRYDALSFPGLHPAILSFVRSGTLNTSPPGRGKPAFEHAFTYVARSRIGQQHGVHSTGSRLFVSKEFGETVTIPRRDEAEVADDFLRPVEWILWSPSTETALVVIPEEVELLIPTLRLAGDKSAVHLIAYATPVTKAMISFNQFQYYSLPRLPLDYKFPDWFRLELGILAGRLYADSDENSALDRYFQPPFDVADNLAKAGTGFKLMNGVGISRFAGDPAAFLLDWLSLRRKTQNVLHTPMGRLCMGQTEEADRPLHGNDNNATL